jgi:hypothetical protein
MQIIKLRNKVFQLEMFVSRLCHSALMLDVHIMLPIAPDLAVMSEIIAVIPWVLLA